MRPLVVTAWVPGGVVGDPLHLDGLLSLAYIRRHRSSHPDRRHKASELHDVALPLARLSALGHRVWVTSAAEAVGVEVPALVCQTGRRDAEDWMHLARTVTVSAGPSKDVLIRRQARVSTALRWYAWGARHEVRRALKLLWGPEETPHGHIGTARRSGSGQIVRWAIEHGDHTPERCFLREDGVTARHLPLGWCTSADVPWRGAVEGPYWLPDRQEPIARLHTHAEVHPGVLQLLGVACCSTAHD